MDDEEKRLVKGFAFLSEKPMLYVENIGEDQLDRLKKSPASDIVHGKTETTIICGKL
jgi:ribosome-binding ATPase YchF (GTP1/OBG family)